MKVVTVNDILQICLDNDLRFEYSPSVSGVLVTSQDFDFYVKAYLDSSEFYEEDSPEEFLLNAIEWYLLNIDVGGIDE